MIHIRRSLAGHPIFSVWVGQIPMAAVSTIYQAPSLRTLVCCKNNDVVFQLSQIYTERFPSTARP